VKPPKRPLLGFSTACLPNQHLLEVLHAGAEAGFEAVKVLAFADGEHSCGKLAGFWWSELSATQRKELQAALAPFEQVSLRMPFGRYPLVSADAAFARLSERRMREAFEAAGALEVTSVTVHAESQPPAPWQAVRAKLLDRLAALEPLAEAAQTKVLVETGYPGRVEDYLDLVAALPSERFGANVDVGHLHAAMDRTRWGVTLGPLDFMEALLHVVETVAPQLHEIHLHDVRSHDLRDHREVGTGFLDFPALFARVKASGACPVLIFELEEPEALPALLRSKERIENIVKALWDV